MKKQDLEVILDSIVSLFNSKFNSKLASIRTEKGDSVVLPDLNSSAFAILGLDEVVMNWDPFIALLIEDLRSVPVPGGLGAVASIYAIAVKEDDGNKAMHKTMLRYQRAVQEIFLDNFSPADTGTIYNIQGLAPQRLQGLNTSKKFRGAGVVVSFPFTS